VAPAPGKEQRITKDMLTELEDTGTSELESATDSDSSFHELKDNVKAGPLHNSGYVNTFSFH
jgi:hypothetical protein